MRPVGRLTHASGAGPRQLVTLGEVLVGVERSLDARRFRSLRAIDRAVGSVPVLAVGWLADGVRVDLDVVASLQDDGTVTVTSSMSLRHLPRDATGIASYGGDAETTVVAFGEERPIALRCFDGHGCSAAVHGRVRNGRVTTVG